MHAECVLHITTEDFIPLQAITQMSPPHNIQADVTPTKTLYGITLTPTSCLFYVNGVLIDTITTNIPSGANAMNFGALGLVTAGTASIYLSQVALSETLI